jgi:hypothetical protein
MPTRPTDLPEWASGGSRRIEPSSGEKSDGWVAATRAAPRKANWIVGVLADWINYVRAIIDANEEHTYQVAKTRELNISPLSMNGTRSDGAGAGSVVWAPGEFAALTFLESCADAQHAYLNLTKLVPHGCSLLEVRAIVKPGAARATTNRMELSVRSNAPNWSSPNEPANVGPYGALDEDDGTTNAQILTTGTSGSLPHVIDSDTNQYWLRIRSGNTGATNLDRIYAIQLRLSDIGPRNV